MALDPRTPIVIGGGQWSNRVDRGEPPVEPADLAAGALRRAGDDTGARGDVLPGLDAIRFVSSLSGAGYRNAPALVAERVGASPRDLALSPVGGNEPQALVDQSCRDIAEGRADLVAICGAEAWRSRARVKAGEDLGWTEQDPSVPPPRLTGPQAELFHPHELARRVVSPTQVYPLFEQALRHAAGRTVDDWLVHLGDLWAGFSAVAAANPHAWIQDGPTAEQIRTPSPDNRWICWPYTKVMNANNAVEQGAAVLLSSVAKAEAQGIPRDRWVFPLAAAEAHDTYAVSNRVDLRSSPALRLTGRRLFELAGLGVDDVAHVDLYSCFPSVVQIAAAELGLALDRQLTVTGGLSFAGGPWNDYVTHSIATMVGVLRDDPGSIGLVGANGGYVTKHALALYATEPPASGFRCEDVQPAVDAAGRRELCEEPDGTAQVESWVVEHDRSGEPVRVIAACLVDDGRRAWATSEDADVVAEMRSGDEQIGRTVKVTPDGALTL